MKDRIYATIWFVLAVLFIILGFITLSWITIIMIVISVTVAGYYLTKLPHESTYNADGKAETKRMIIKQRIWNAKLENTNAFCENCGNSLKSTTKFCGKCGNQV